MVAKDCRVELWRHFAPNIRTDDPEEIARHLRELSSSSDELWEYLTIRKIESERYGTYIPLATLVRVEPQLAGRQYHVSAEFDSWQSSVDILRGWSIVPERIAGRGLAMILASHTAPSVPSTVAHGVYRAHPQFS